METTASCQERPRVRIATLAGALAWIATPWLPLGTPPAFASVEHGFLFFPLVAAPLALALASSLLQPRGAAQVLYRFARRLQPLASASVLAAFLVGGGAVAAALVVPWIAMALLLGIAGVPTARLGVRPHLSRLNLLVAHVFLPIGTVWLLMTRIGVEPAGLPPVGVMLATLHFHFSGFTLQILIAATARRLPSSARRLAGVHRCIAVGGIAGIPLISAGKLLGVPMSATLGITIVVLTTVALAAVAGVVALTVRPVLSRRLLLVSSASIGVAMLLAGAFRISELTEAHWIGIDDMVATHGLLNALGFVACGLIGHLRLAVADASS